MRHKTFSPRLADPPAPGGSGYEGALIAAAREGDFRAFEVLVRRHNPRLYRVAVRRVGDPGTAEDVLQEVWLAAWRFLPDFAGRSTLGTWLQRMTINAAGKAAGGSRRRVATAATEFLETRLGPACSAERCHVDGALRAAVRRAVRALPADLRTVVVLYHFEDMDYAQIAAVLEVSEATVRGRLHRGRRHLATALERWR